MIAETIEYKNQKIEIIQDECPENPLELWDCMPELHSTGGSGDIDLLAPELTRDQIKKNAATICELTGEKTLLALSSNNTDYYRSNYEDATFMVNTAICNRVEELSKSDKCDALATLFNIAGIRALSEGISGYSQDSYATVLVIATPEWIKETGIRDANIERALQSTIETYAAWRYGDVYGFSVEELELSCFGFYGAHGSKEYNYMIEEAKHAIDYELQERASKRIKKLSTLIKNKTPLTLRAEILATI